MLYIIRSTNSSRIIIFFHNLNEYKNCFIYMRNSKKHLGPYYETLFSFLHPCFIKCVPIMKHN